MAKNDKITIGIGPGKAVYPRLKTPDTKFDELGQYKADLAVPLQEAEPVMKKLSKIHKDYTGKAPKKSENTMWVLETDDDGNETGNVVFKIRVKNKRRKSDGEIWDRRPKQFDAQLRPIDVNPYGGTVMEVNAEVYCWDTGSKQGVSLQPMGVQILELVTGTGPTGESMGFSKKDGYETDDDGAYDDDDDDDVNDDEDDADDGDY